jgi:glycyl-tRNA synthetase beta chain
MSELLIELFSEEIPAMMQSKAEIAYFNIFTKYFQEKKIGFKYIEIFVGPRRVVIHADGLDKEIKGQAISIKGPKVGSPELAIEGFCKSNNINKADLVIQDVKGAKCYFYEKEITSQKITDIFLKSLAEPIMEYVWSKSMYWSDYKIKWVRPLKNILCVFDGEIIPFKLGHLTANNITFGHRFMSPKEILVKNVAKYKEDLEDNFVMLDRSDRIRKIEAGLKIKIDDLNKKYKSSYFIKHDPTLLEEVAGLVEWPVVLHGSIDDKFLALPTEVLVASMRTHQKYFSFSVFFNPTLVSAQGEPFKAEESFFAPFFLFVSNIESSDESIVIEGNKKVLSARLDDALYFYNQDLKTTLKEKSKKLDKVVFHAKLGSMRAKIDRLKKLVAFINPNANDIIAAASICKSDIVSEVVCEFPSLQGIMGYYYAKSEGKEDSVAIAIRDHYKPQGPSDSVPSKEPGLLALADKIDSLCGLMLAGEKPTGSKDPYALRRLALGIIRIILENQWVGNVNITELVGESCKLYSKIINYSKNDQDQIILFTEERARNYFKDKFDNSQVNASVNFKLEPSLLATKSKLEAVKEFLSTDEGKDLLKYYKRVSNMIGSANIDPDDKIDSKIELLSEEKKLLEYVENNSDSLIHKSILGYNVALQELLTIKVILDRYFENVMVMDKDPLIAKNRLLILAKTKRLFNRIVNFDLL